MMSITKIFTQNRSRRHSAAPYLFLLPAMVYFLVFWVGPFFFTVFISMTDWNILGDLSKINFEGFSNYIELFTQDAIFMTALRNTFFYAVINTPLVIVLGLALALLLRTKFYGRTIVRTLAFVPYGTSLVALAIIWRYIYSPQAFGVLNSFLSLFGIENQSWLSSAQLALPSIMAMDVWKWTGYTMVIFLVALSNIPKVYYDAAAIDGANNRKQFWFITLPLLRPALLFTFVTGTIGAFQVFAQVYVMTQGGPANSTEVIVHYMYRVAFKWLKMGDAAAMSLVLLALILVFALFEYGVLEKRE